MYELHGHLVKVIGVLVEEIRPIAFVKYVKEGFYRETYLDLLVLKQE
jgi:hypothetical protein